jgi:hypothetical protein
MQRLDIVARLFPLVVRGEKVSTIRFREQQIRIGPMVYWCDGLFDKSATVWVHRCTNIALSEAANFLGKTKEWPDSVMLEGMRTHYPDIQLSDIVQVIEHYNPKESLPYLIDKAAVG